MLDKDYLKLFERTQALLKGHFKLSSGLHSPEYFQCALVLQYPEYAEELGKDLAEKLRSLKPTAVVSPALGGVIIGQEVARALKVKAIFTERKEGAMELRRGFSVSPEDRLVVIEDVITTGGSTKEVIKVVEGLGGKVVAVGSIVDRTSESPNFPVAYECLLKMKVVAFKETEIPDWLAKVPITKPGSRPEKTSK
jgi:orotate phosphoribosyltransferase